jgi:hypothetical protein
VPVPFFKCFAEKLASAQWRRIRHYRLADYDDMQQEAKLRLWEFAIEAAEARQEIKHAWKRMRVAAINLIGKTAGLTPNTAQRAVKFAGVAIKLQHAQGGKKPSLQEIAADAGWKRKQAIATMSCAMRLFHVFPIDETPEAGKPARAATCTVPPGGQRRAEGPDGGGWQRPVGACPQNLPARGLPRDGAQEDRDCLQDVLARRGPDDPPGENRVAD